MLSRRFLILPLLLAACEAPAPVTVADPTPNYISYHNNLVLGDATAPGSFEVIRRSGDAATDLWCAAGEYADRVIGVHNNRRIYVVKPLSRSVRRPDRQSVIFTVNPTEEQRAFKSPEGDFSLTVRRVGESQQTAVALQYCRKRPRFFLFSRLTSG